MDGTDLRILEILQRDARATQHEIARQVRLSQPSVADRIHKLEARGVILGYVARVDPAQLGKDITAFIGVATERARDIARIEREVVAYDDVLECHHVTGAWTLMLKAKTRDTESLEELIESIRSCEGVARTETMVVLSTHTERSRVALPADEETPVEAPRAPRRSGASRARKGGA